MQSPAGRAGFSHLLKKNCNSAWGGAADSGNSQLPQSRKTPLELPNSTQCTSPDCFRAKIDACMKKTLETKPQLIQISAAWNSREGVGSAVKRWSSRTN